MDDRLTLEELRQRLSEAVPGFMSTLAAALGLTPAELQARVEKGAVTKSTALIALAREAISLADYVARVEAWKNEMERDIGRRRYQP